MYLGIDLGTSKVAAVLLDDQGVVQAVASNPHWADLASSPGHHEQDAEKLLQCAWATVRELPVPSRQEVKSIGVTGQMHGVVLLNEKGQTVSPLITWQDQRCLEEAAFLPSLRRSSSAPMAAGFGCATLAWLTQTRKMPADACIAATIQDLAAARLCGISRPSIDPTDAASWGFFDLARLEWESDAITAAGILPGLVPPLLPSGSRLGMLSRASSMELGLPRNSSVLVALGDNQASMLATLADLDSEMALTVGTGAQLSAVLPRQFTPAPLPPNTPYEYRPFPGNRCAIVAAVLAGGSAWKWMMETIVSWLSDLGIPVPGEIELYRKLNELGQAAERIESPCFKPHFLGERHEPGLRASIGKIDLENFRLGTLARALAEGIFKNLREMLPATILENRARLIASGNALAKNPLLLEAAREVFGLPILLKEQREEAATGAALLARNLS
jgi:sedoheptulokinase